MSKRVARKWSFAGLLILCTATLPTFGAVADPGDEPALDEVVVSGTRIIRPGFDAPTPTTVLSGDLIEKQDLTNVADLLNQVPAFRGSSTPSTATSGFREGAGGNFVNLRGLGANRTLVLIDGARVVPTTSIGTVDLNLIPTIMVERADVVTGGASAAYGSDAVAGVVNLMLKKTFTGFDAQVQAGQSQYGDDRNYLVSAVGGQTLGAVHLLGGAEYDKNNGIGGISERDWSRRAVGINVGAGNVRYIADDYQTSTQTYGGIINSGPLRGTAFAPDGTPFAFQYGNLFGNPNSPSMAGGGNPRSFNYDQLDLSDPYERYSLLGRADYAFSSNTSGYVTVNYAHVGGSHPVVEPRDTSLVVRRDNAYLPDSVRAQMVADNLQTITIGRNSRDLGAYESDEGNDTWRIGSGIAGELGRGWHWDAHASYGQNRLTNDLGNLRIDGAVPGDPAGTRRWLNSIDAVVNPANGQVVCRTTLTNPGNGCVPFDIFGENGSITAAQKAWLTGTAVQRQRTSQSAGSVNLQGNPFSTWAGDVSIAAGGEYRKDSIHSDSDAISIARAFNISNPQPLDGSITVYEGYGETVVPLAKDLPMLKSVEFNGAIRRTHYSLAGSVTTWKTGLTWQPNEDVRFRATKSRDIRAPNLSESFSAGIQANAQINGGPLVTTLNTGNPNLKPERADTVAAGVGISPTALPNFRVNADYYKIDIASAITTISAQAIYSGCILGQNPSYCQYIDSSGRYLVTPANVSAQKTSGVDTEVGYGFNAPGGHVDLSLLATYVKDLITVDSSGVWIDRAGQVGGGILTPGLDTPHWLGGLNIHYSIGQFGVNLHARYVEHAKLDVQLTPAQLNINEVSSRTYFNLAGDYTVAHDKNGEVQVFAAVNNLTNLEPPRWMPLQLYLVGNTAGYYDSAGRSFTVGARMKF